MVTAEQVETAMRAAGITEVEHHRCAICRCMVFYRLRGDQLYFDSACACDWSTAGEPRTWQQVADLINMQSTLEWRTAMAARFGIKESSK